MSHTKLNLDNLQEVLEEVKALNPSAIDEVTLTHLGGQRYSMELLLDDNQGYLDLLSPTAEVWLNGFSTPYQYGKRKEVTLSWSSKTVMDGSPFTLHYLTRYQLVSYNANWNYESSEYDNKAVLRYWEDCEEDSFDNQVEIGYREVEEEPTEPTNTVTVTVNFKPVSDTRAIIRFYFDREFPAVHHASLFNLYPEDNKNRLVGCYREVAFRSYEALMTEYERTCKFVEELVRKADERTKELETCESFLSTDKTFTVTL